MMNFEIAYVNDARNENSEGEDDTDNKDGLQGDEHGHNTHWFKPKYLTPQRQSRSIFSTCNRRRLGSCF